VSKDVIAIPTFIGVIPAKEPESSKETLGYPGVHSLALIGNDACIVNRKKVTTRKS
jgi:hypothetical protein